MKNESRVQVVQPEPPIDKNVLAQAIVDIGLASRKLMSSGITRDAVVVLLHDRCKVSKTTIKLVIGGLGQLERDFCK